MKKLALLLILLLCLSSASFAADEWNKLVPLDSDSVSDYPTDAQVNNEAVDRLLSNHRQLMLLSFASNSTITVGPGEIVCSNLVGDVRKFRKNTSSTTLAWTDIDTGSEASSTTYYVYAVCDADATTATFKISASGTAPSGATYYKRIGTFYNDSNSNIRQIINYTAYQYREKESKTVGSTYQATTDGVVVLIGSITSPCRGQLLRLYSDNNSTPTTLVGSDSSGSDQGSGGTLTWPVKAGDYYKGTWSTQAGDSCSVGGMYFVPKY